MNLIAAVDKNFGIGKDGDMPWHIPADLQYFKQMTLGKTIIMGRKTLESLPGGKPLKGRDNIVITANSQYICEGAAVCHSIDEAIEAVKDLPSDDVMVIGGAGIYGAMYSYCKRAYITKIDAEYDVDTSIVNLDEAVGWRIERVGDVHSDGEVEYRHVDYVNDLAD